MHKWLTVAVLALVPTTSVLGAGGSIAKGAVVLSYGPAHWSETQSAALSGSEADPESSTVYQTGWWYRLAGQSREYPLPPPDSETYGAGHGSAVWNNLEGSGLEVHEEFDIVDNGGPSATYHSNLWVLNHAADDIGLALFHYLNADAGGTLAGDSGVLSAPGLIRFLDGASSVRYEAGDEAGGPVHVPQRFVAGSATAVKALLTNSTVDDLPSNGLPFGPGEMGAAFEWTGVVVAGSGSGLLEVVVSVNTHADLVKGDGLVGLSSRNGYSDIVFRRLADNSLLFWDLEGTQRVRAAGGGPNGSAVLVAIDDFDGDRLSNLVFHDEITGLVSFRIAGAGDVPLSGAAPLPLNWRIAATADFDHDGRPDVLWRNTTSQRLVVWTMNGTAKAGNITPSPDYAVDANWEVVGAADMNGDGNVDLVWYNLTSGRCVIWYMDAAVARTSAGFTTPMAAGDANWRIVATGDWGKGSGAERSAVNGANDLLWRNSTSGRLVVWHMNLAGQRTSGTFTSPDGPPLPLDYVVAGPR